MPKLRLIISLLLFALLLTACPHPIPTPTPTPTLTPAPTPTLSPTPISTLTPVPIREYRNLIYGFALSYPEDWEVKEREGLPQPAVILNPPAGFPAIQVSVSYLPQPATPKEAAYRAFKALKEIALDLHLLKEEELGGGYALEAMWTTKEGVTLKGKFFYQTRGSQVLEISSFSPLRVFEKNREEIERIITSFHLIEPKPLELARYQTLTLHEREPFTLDPALSSEMGSLLYIVQIFGGLVKIDENLNLIPDIAQNWGISADGTTYTFHLRPGVKFHNGREVKAYDVKYSWERATDPALGSPTAPTYLGDILGVKEKLAGKAKEIKGVKVINDYTLQVKIDAPKPYLLYKLSYPPAFVLPQEVIEELGKDWWRQKPIGTGPFKLKEWKKGQVLVLERNPDYHLSPPKIKYVLYKLFGGIPMLMYEEGEIDIAAVSSVGIERATDPKGPFAKELMEVPEFSLFYLGFNATKPPFNNSDIRKAFSLAIDKDKIVKDILKDTVIRADGILPPGFPGYNPELKPLGYDLKKAKELLARYKDKLPKSITITIPGLGEGAPNWLQAVLKHWQDNLEVNFTIRQLTPEIYYSRLKEEKDDIFVIGWIADYPDPENFLDILFHSRSPQNFGEYSNPDIDKLLEQARVEANKEKRFGLYKQIEQMLVNDAPIIPIWFSKSYFLVKPYIKGFTVSSLGIPTLDKVELQLPEEKS